MKIVLVFPPFYLASMYNLPPLGLINIATALKDEPHQVVIIDLVLAIRQGRLQMGRSIYSECVSIILNQDPDIVGFSAQCTTYPAVIQIAKKLKVNKPGLKIVIGGHNASFVDRLTLENYPFIDSIVRGEGEITFKELTACYAKGKLPTGISGVTWRYDSQIIKNQERELIKDLNELSLPDYSYLPTLDKYRDGCQLSRSIAILEVGRGCPHNCIYCSESILWRRRTRTLSPERLILEMKNLANNYKAECFLMAYDQFTANRNFVESFCYQLIESGLNQLPWYCISRLDSVDKEILNLMRRAGCESMCYGIDSGSKKTLAFIRKKIDHQILYKRVVETSEEGLVPTLSFVAGFPVEDKEDIDQTLVMALQTGIIGNNNPLIQMPTVLPGTDLHAYYGKKLVREVDTYFALGLEFDKGQRLSSDEELIDSSPLIFSSFYNLPCPGRTLEELNLIAAYFPLIVRLFPKTFLILSIECQKSVGDLFLQWLSWLRKKTNRNRLSLSPQDCYIYFRKFVTGILNKRDKIKLRHIWDIVKYEYLSLEVGKFPPDKNSFDIDLNQINELKPLKSQEIIIEKFDFNTPSIIIDLKDGKFKENYSPRETYLIFKQEGDTLEVTEINSFGKDFIKFCDGKTTFESITNQLYNHYVSEINKDIFFDSCVEALHVFVSSKLLISG